MKRGIALFLTLVLILGTLPATALATGGTLEGEGTKDSPYQIRDAEDLTAFGALVDEGNTVHLRRASEQHRPDGV